MQDIQEIRLSQDLSLPKVGMVVASVVGNGLPPHSCRGVVVLYTALL